ncbi:zf-HC2 domain-containing protein [Kitasatospora sp. NPDC050543]|uniref:zf-HC2 domain-containing protein n=1 Tax=Kitasatospora sp. NPDC050543 TaxID=3364054 RepID=UPI0037B5CD7E
MTSPREDHVDVGAYVLGVLDEPERSAFERHLAGCAQCAQQVEELGGLEPILAEYLSAGGPDAVDPADPAPRVSEDLLGRLVGEVAATRRRGRTRRLVLVAAAAVLVVGGPAVTVAVVSADHGAATTSVAQQFTATDPLSGARATVGVAGKQWGSQVSLELSNVRGPLSCDLVAVSRSGERQTVTTWTVPDTGYGTAQAPDALRTGGGAGLQLKDIDHFEVRTLDGRQVLVSVPVQAQAQA